MAVGLDQRHQLGIGEVAIATQQETGLGPVAAQASAWSASSGARPAANLNSES